MTTLTIRRQLPRLRDAALYILSLAPFLLGLLIGAVVAIVVWSWLCVVDGYETGRGDR